MSWKILLVDDEADLLAGWERVLRPLGGSCLTATTGSEAIALIDRHRLDLVVSDLRLPGVDGLAVARHARAHVPFIPVILISAEDSDRAKAEARELGVSAFLTKPFSNAVFRETVAGLLENASSRSTDLPAS